MKERMNKRGENALKRGAINVKNKGDVTKNKTL